MAQRAISYAVLQEHHQQKRHDPHIPPLDLSECVSAALICAIWISVAQT